MSSILKALKKLETEQTQQGRVRSLSQTVRRQKEKTGKIHSFPQIIAVCSGVILTGALVAGGFIGVSRMIDRKEKAVSGDLPEKNEAPAPLSAVLSQPAPKRARAQEEGVKTVAPEEAPEKQGPAPPQAVLMSGKNAKGRAVASSDKLPADLPGRHPSVETKEPKGAAKRPPAPSTLPSPGVLKPDENGIKIVRDPGLKLMAVAWSAIPADRIAVINGRIVREGETIDGVFVSRINEDEVILQKGDELVKLIFRVQ